MTAPRLLDSIPERINSPARLRLRTLRKSRKKSQIEFKTCTSSALNKYEKYDISTMTIRILVSLAEEYEMTPVEFFSYLFEEDEKKADLGIVQYNLLSEKNKHLAADIMKDIYKQQIAK